MAWFCVSSVVDEPRSTTHFGLPWLSLPGPAAALFLK